jgi:hypothetical protein
MAMNQVQFQQGLSMTQFMAQYGTEAKCRRALFRSRWPRGYRCAACAGCFSSRFRREGQLYYQCRACRHQTTLLSGTLFEATKLPLTTWFLAIHLLTSTKTNMAALELKRHLGVTYRTAWRLKHKVMEAMMQREEPRQLNGFVQIDDAYLGGERNGGKPGRGSENKQAFLTSVPFLGSRWRPTRRSSTRCMRSSSRCAASTTTASRTGEHAIWHPTPRFSAMACFASAASPMPGTRTQCWRPAAAAPPARCAARAGSQEGD